MTSFGLLVHTRGFVCTPVNKTQSGKQNRYRNVWRVIGLTMFLLFWVSPR